MASKHMKWFSISITREMQMKMTVIYHNTHIRMSTFLKVWEYQTLQRCDKAESHIRCGKNVKWCSPYGK